MKVKAGGGQLVYGSDLLSGGCQCSPGSNPIVPSKMPNNCVPCTINIE